MTPPNMDILIWKPFSFPKKSQKFNQQLKNKKCHFLDFSHFWGYFLDFWDHLKKKKLVYVYVWGDHSDY